MADAACPICLAPAARFEDRPKLKVAAIQVD